MLCGPRGCANPQNNRRCGQWPRICPTARFEEIGTLSTIHQRNHEAHSPKTPKYNDGRLAIAKNIASVPSVRIDQTMQNTATVRKLRLANSAFRRLPGSCRERSDFPPGRNGASFIAARINKTHRLTISIARRWTVGLVTNMPTRAIAFTIKPSRTSFLGPLQDFMPLSNLLSTQIDKHK